MQKPLLAALAMIAALAAPAANAATIDVLRGSDSARIDTTQNGVTVLKPALVPAINTAKPVRRNRHSHVAVSVSDTLWLVDQRTGRLSACWVGGTGYAGRSAIRCTADRQR